MIGCRVKCRIFTRENYDLLYSRECRQQQQREAAKMEIDTRVSTQLTQPKRDKILDDNRRARTAKCPPRKARQTQFKLTAVDFSSSPFPNGQQRMHQSI